MTTPDNTTSPGDRRILIAIVVLAAVLRLLATVVLPDQQFPDAAGYRAAGLQFWSTGQLGTHHIMPLYPLLVGVAGAGWGQLLMDAALSTASVWLLHVLTWEVFADRAAAHLAALAAAIYPHFIFFSVAGLTATLFIALILAAFTAWYRGAFTIAAIFAVLSILTRPSIDVLAPLLVIYFAAVVHRLPWPTVVRKCLGYAAVYLVLMAPWWLHNFQTYGTFVRLNLGSADAFYMGNNPMNRTGGGISGVDGDMTTFDAIKDPAARNAALWKAGLDYVRGDPLHFIEMAAVKFTRLWRPWPYTQSYRGLIYVLASLISFAPMLLLALLYLGRWGYAELARIGPVMLFAIFLTAVHMVTVASIRYRLPIEPFVLVFGAVAAARLARRWPISRSLIARLDAEPRSR